MKYIIVVLSTYRRMKNLEDAREILGDFVTSNKGNTLVVEEIREIIGRDDWGHQKRERQLILFNE